jgi:pimeloyl-ACP methyl ester carboxylesterase
MHQLELGTARLACLDQGQGETVVLVHGSNSDMRTWKPVRDSLSRQHRIFAYSRRYHWPNESIAPGTDYAMQQQLDDLAATVASLDAGAVHLVGHSYGALLCLHLALQAPASVRSLVLAEPPAIRLFTSTPPLLPELLAVALRHPRTAWAIGLESTASRSHALEAITRHEMHQASNATRQPANTAG